MISLFFNTLKLLRSIIIGIKRDQDFRVLLFLLVVLLSGATVFYRHVEGWSVLDSLYFSVMTMSTIGYGDMVPSNSYSKIFTIIYTFLGVGLFASFMSKIVSINLDRHKRLLRRHSKTARNDET